MTIEFTRWPQERADLYRRKGYWIDQPLTRILLNQSLTRPDAPAILCGERCISYAMLDQLSGNLATRLRLAGISQSDTALVQLPNIAEFYIVFFALLKAGIVPVNAIYSHRRLELTAYARQIKPKLIIATKQHELFKDNRFLEELDAEGLRPQLTLLAGDDSDAHEANELGNWLQEPDGSIIAPTLAPTPADEVAFFQLSGGSTGTPKLIPRTHNDYDYSVRASADICELTPQTRFLCALPAAHNYALSSPGALGVFHAGGCVILAPNPEPLGCFTLIERHRIDMAALVPPAVALWLHAAPEHQEKLHSLRLIQVGGASFAEVLARKVPEILHCRLQQVFGMAEGLVNYTRAGDDEELVFTTQGRPISPDDEIRITDENGNELPDGEAGMLATRGPYTFCGYYNSPEHNARIFDKEGFYYSGDIVERNAQGYLRVVGRVKDQINRGGEKVASEEIENLIVLHDDVTHAALVAMDDELLGEKSCAFVVSRNPQLKAPTLRRHLAALGIAEYKLPDRIQFIEHMPLTPVGKIDKKHLRSLLAQNASAL